MLFVWTCSHCEHRCTTNIHRASRMARMLGRWIMRRHPRCASFTTFQDGLPAQWDERLAGYYLLLAAGALVQGLQPRTFDAFLIEAGQLARRKPLQLSDTPVCADSQAKLDDF